MIEQSKSPKSLAYARLGKPTTGKSSLQEEHRKPNRNSTGTIFEDLLGQIGPADNAYIRELITKNQREAGEQHSGENFHSRKKSYAEIVIDSSCKDKPRAQKPRQERETLSKSKHPGDNFLMQAATPKNSSVLINNRVPSRNSSNAMISSFKKEPRGEGSFLDSLGSYIEELTEAPESHGKISFNNVQKLSETLKISSGEGDSIKMASKLEQYHMKIKQLKLKTYYQEKELGKNAKKEMKMKESLFEMLAEIKQLGAQLTYQKKERKKLEKIIDTFDIRRGKLERKTIGKLHNFNLDQFDNEHTENEFERDLDDSLRGYVKRSVDKKASTCKIYANRRKGGLDEEKIKGLLRSNYNSDESDD